MPFVQAVLAVLPEFDPMRCHAVAAPVWRAWDGFAGESLDHFLIPRFKRRAAIEWLGLVARQSMTTEPLTGVFYLLAFDGNQQRLLADQFPRCVDFDRGTRLGSAADFDCILRDEIP